MKVNESLHNAEQVSEEGDVEAEEARDASENDDFEPAKPNASKRKKPKDGASKATSGKKKKAGSLSKILELPFELFVAICEDLSHRDFWVLSQVSHRFNDFARDPCLVPVWHKAEEEAGLPVPLQVPMLPLQLAHLCYSKLCSECSKGPVHRRFWDHRTIVCSRCEKAAFNKWSKISATDSLHPVTSHAFKDSCRSLE